MKLTFSPFRPTSSLPWTVGFAAVLLLLQLAPEEWQSLLRYERAEVEAGQWWRLFTGNLVHLGFAHLALNGAALLIGAWLFAEARTPPGWALALLTCGLCVNLGLYCFSPQIDWCVGLSGALHGLLVVGAIDWVRRGDRIGWLLLIAWCAKVLWEQTGGPLPMSEGMVGGAVITDAHLWGLVGGLIFALGDLGWRHGRLRL